MSVHYTQIMQQYIVHVQYDSASYTHNTSHTTSYTYNILYTNRLVHGILQYVIFLQYTLHV